MRGSKSELKSIPKTFYLEWPKAEGLQWWWHWEIDRHHQTPWPMRVLYVKLKKHLLGGNLRFLTFSFFSFVFCMYVALTFECWFLLFWEHSLTLMCLDCMKLLMFWVICWWLDWALPKLRLWSWLVFICFPMYFVAFLCYVLSARLCAKRAWSILPVVLSAMSH